MTVMTDPPMAIREWVSIHLGGMGHQSGDAAGGGSSQGLLCLLLFPEINAVHDGMSA